MTRPLLALALASAGTLPALGACGRRDAPPPLCDGSPGLRLEIRSSGGLRALPEERAFYDVGWWYLLVDGSCRYWVATDAGLSTRTGVADEAALLAALRHDTWKDVAGTWRGEGGDDFLAADGTTRIACQGGCDHPGTPKQVRAIREAAFAEAERLARLGEPPEGPVDVLVIRGGGLSGDGHAEWPLDRPIREFARAPDAPEKPLRIEDPEDAAALRAIRRRATAYRVFVIVSDGAEAYRVYVRDALPPAAAYPPK